MAETLAKQAAAALGFDGIQVGSAGVSAQDGEPASPGAQRAMQSRNLSLEAHRARRLTPELIAEADLILTMTSGHSRAVKNVVPDAKVLTLYEYLGEAGDVADPWGGSDTEYESCARVLAPRVHRAVERFSEKGCAE